MSAVEPFGWRDRLTLSPRATPATVAWVVATVTEAQRILDTLPPDPDAEQHREALR